MPRSKATDYDTCPICQGRRWKGHSLPVCDRCVIELIDAEFLSLRRRLKADNASGTVINLLDQAMIEDAKETLKEATYEVKIRRPRQTGNSRKTPVTTAQ